MIVRPKKGQKVQVWYRKGLRDGMPHHGKIGHVALIAMGPGPRNHGVVIDGQIIGIPCGNLRKPK